MAKLSLHAPVHPVRFVTAASLFDGHDASINIMRRILQSQGAEVIHLGHNRSVEEVLVACLHEDVQGVAVSSYQGGHVEYFKYLVDQLQARGAGNVKVYGGGGGTIVSKEIAELEAYGVEKIFSPEDGQRLGLAGMINTMIKTCDVDPVGEGPPALEDVFAGDQRALARLITALQCDALPEDRLEELRRAAGGRSVPVLGITGTGGSGKSSLTDELLRRLRLDQEDKLRVAVIAVDPTRRKGGGALLGDRIRMNTLDSGQVYFRSLATRGAKELPEALDDIIASAKAAGFDLVIVETPGIGQGDAAIVPHVDVPIYVMTPEFGAASQLEKIDMLDFAEAVVINKFDRRGAEDALRDVRRQLVRNREAFSAKPEEMPVYGTVASRFHDDGVTALYQQLRGLLVDKGLKLPTEGALAPVDSKVSSEVHPVVPPDRSRYLAEIASTVRDYHRQTAESAAAARRCQALEIARGMLAERDGVAAIKNLASTTADLDAALAEAREAVPEADRKLLERWPSVVERYSGEEMVVKVRDRELHTTLVRESLSGSKIPRVALPRYEDHGELLRFLRSENLPGHYPFTAGVFSFKREGEDPARMFAGEGDPFRTNRRFRYLAEGHLATRLSTAFDSVTLYGFDPDERPDIYGKVGTSGVSIATLDDMKVLYSGFDLCDPTTSVTMTINGPAPTILAMFLNTAIDQRVEAF
ncbi:MAG: methylmalonyl-CoA mutase family protein, partial [Acidimicrobiia bacterium]